MREGIIYKVVNKVNDKIYIGQTISGLKIRKNKHLYDTKKINKNYFHRALAKYGNGSFEWIVLCTSPEEYLNKLEKHFIKHYNSFGESGYNLTSGGDHCKMSDETKAKISKAGKGRITSEETKQKMKEAAIKRWNKKLIF